MFCPEGRLVTLTHLKGVEIAFESFNKVAQDLTRLAMPCFTRRKAAFSKGRNSRERAHLL